MHCYSACCELAFGRDHCHRYIIAGSRRGPAERGTPWCNGPDSISAWRPAGPTSTRKVRGKRRHNCEQSPYVSTSRPDLVQREVRDFEPAIALYGGPDGLSFYRRLLVDAARFLKPDGHLVCEIGYSQLDDVLRLADAAGWDFANLAEDLQGIPRTLTVRRKEAYGYRAD